MPLWEILIFLLIILIVFTIIHYIGKNKRPFRRAILSVISGLITLFAVNLTAAFTGVYLPVSLLSLIVACVGGIPGVTLLLGLNLFF